MSTNMTLTEVVELSTIENYNFAREMVDTGAWTKQMMMEYLSSKLNVITEIEIESENKVSNEILFIRTIMKLGKGLNHMDYVRFSNTAKGMFDNAEKLNGNATYNDCLDGVTKALLFGNELELFETLIDLKMAKYID